MTSSELRVKARRERDKIILCGNKALMPIIILGHTPDIIADCTQ